MKIAAIVLTLAFAATAAPSGNAAAQQQQGLFSSLLVKAKSVAKDIFGNNGNGNDNGKGVGNGKGKSACHD